MKRRLQLIGVLVFGLLLMGCGPDKGSQVQYDEAPKVEPGKNRKTMPGKPPALDPPESN
jgi:hypothetical protein